LFARCSLTAHQDAKRKPPEDVPARVHPGPSEYGGQQAIDDHKNVVIYPGLGHGRPGDQGGGQVDGGSAMAGELGQTILGDWKRPIGSEPVSLLILRRLGAGSSVCRL